MQHILPANDVKVQKISTFPKYFPREFNTFILKHMLKWLQGSRYISIKPEFMLKTPITPIININKNS